MVISLASLAKYIGEGWIEERRYTNRCGAFVVVRRKR